MSLLPFGSPPPTINNVSNGNLNKLLQFGDWSVITTNSMASTAVSRLAGTTSYGITGRCEVNPPAPITAVKAGFINWYASGSNAEIPNTNTLFIKASLQPQGTTIDDSVGAETYDFTFGGKSVGVIGRGNVIFTDPLEIPFSSRFFIKVYACSALNAAPSAPTATGNTGAGSSFTQGQVIGTCLTIVYADGSESAASTSTSVTIGSNGNRIIVTSPTAVPGAIGYRAWITAAGGSSTGPHYQTTTGITPFGVDASIITPAQGTFLQYLEQVDPTGATYIPIAGSTLGGTSNGASNNGEGYSGTSVNANLDLTDSQSAVPAGLNNNLVYLPSVVMGRTSPNFVKSFALYGNSISRGVGDGAFGGGINGGFMKRAVQNQVTYGSLGYGYDPSIVPLYGHISLGLRAETLSQVAAVTGNKRIRLGQLCSNGWSEYGTNDLSGGAGSAISSEITYFTKLTRNNKRVFQSDICSRVTSSNDLYATISGQLSLASVSEATRRILNNFYSSSTGAVSVTGDVPFRGYSGTVGPSYNMYGGGDGTIRIFYMSQLFRQGTETVYNNGTPVSSSNYAYVNTATIKGIAYAAGVNFNSAPSNGAVITADYTKIAGMLNLFPSSRFVPSGLGISVDANGLPSINGGWVKPSGAISVGPRAVTGVTGTSLTDSTQTWTQDQWRGYAVGIVSDPVTPTAVGQISTIDRNTSTVLAFSNGWSGGVTPSSSATYQIFTCYMLDGVHPTTQGHIAMAIEAQPYLALHAV